jgi:urea transporter/murein DD-endopeptidase MepM/ murein hydrolase activator NlpD
MSIIRNYFNGFISSYSQVFFSDNKAYAYWLLVASFANWTAGISGAISVLISLLFANWLGLDKALIKSGHYSYNALLLGLAMGSYYEFGTGFWLLLMVFSIFTVFLTKTIAVFFQKYTLPVLNLPFILTLWTMTLSIRSFQTITISERGLFKLNELYATGGMTFVNVYQWLTDMNLPPLMDAYFKSLGAIYFQFSTIAGIFIAIGLLFYSRIAFTLSIIGFLTGFYFFKTLNGTVSEYIYAYVGFNYILAAISLGGFYVVPSRKSYLLAFISAMIIAILYAALYGVFIKLQLPVYSFPCTATVLLILISLKYKPESKGLELVNIQNYAPEKNLYKHIYNAERYQNDTLIQIHPPFFGEWLVSQGHNGGITHLGDWQYAWDFVIVDDDKKTYRGFGNELTDYYCYNVPILAPAAGYVTQIIDNVEDNAVGGMDIQQNWGNTIVIKHSEGLYSKISHIKQETFKVAVGDYVYRGQFLANCGNSGRSPEPHIHFQLQTTPHVGSKTLNYPLAYFMEKLNPLNSKNTEGGNDLGFQISDFKFQTPDVTSDIWNLKSEIWNFNAFSIPKQDTIITGVQATHLLTQAYLLTPGTILQWEESIETNNKTNKKLLKWEVFTDAYNQTYIYCNQTESYAYFVNNGTLLYFTDFVGDKNSSLYAFYVGCHKLLLGYYKDLIVHDLLPISSVYKGVLKIIQDFIAPFYLFLKADYQSICTEIDDINYPQTMTISAKARVLLGNTIQKQLDFTIHVDSKGLNEFKMVDKNEIRTLKRL